jgi:hypothetical protein
MRQTIVCLANSYKQGGRCVAGISLETDSWVRLRQPDGDGSFTVQQCTLADGGGELRLLDVFEVELHYAMPTDCHPEDWVVAPTRWRLIERPCSTRTLARLEEKVERRGPLLGAHRDRTFASELRSRPLAASLALICPADLWWWVREERGRLKYRALFHRDNVTYDLAVTDPHWLTQLQLLPAGIHPHSLLAPEAQNTWLTLSLSEPFTLGSGQPAHFRLVAGVIPH